MHWYVLPFSADRTLRHKPDLGNILNNVLGGSTSTSDVVSGITSIFSSSKQATESNIVGTWEYEEPAILLKSDNVLTNAAAKVAANTAEKKLQAQLEKIGIKKGALTMTFNSDGTFSETFGSKKSSGTWTICDSKLILKHTLKSVTLTTQVSGDNLMFVTNLTCCFKLDVRYREIQINWFSFYFWNHLRTIILNNYIF